MKWEHIPQSHQNVPSLISDHVRLYPTVISEWPSVPNWAFLVTDQVPPFQEWHSVLISDHVGNNPTVTSKWLGTHIWHGRNQSSHHDRMANPLHLTMEGTNPLTRSECLTESSLPLGGNPIWRTPSFSLKYSNFTLAISRIEPHQGWLRSRITCELFQDWLHPRITYMIDYI